MLNSVFRHRVAHEGSGERRDSVAIFSSSKGYDVFVGWPGATLARCQACDTVSDLLLGSVQLVLDCLALSGVLI